MRPQVGVIFACMWATAAVAAQTSFPYKAYVVVEEAYVRSGPGEGFYPTEKIRFGREVEVYQRDAAGWCAIRPLEESFSWVPGWDIRLGDDGLAEVATHSVAARVGSQFSDVRDVVQVRLKRGELVEVLGWKRMGTGAGTQTWYRIAPPAGEFRWIHERYLDAYPPQARIVRAAAEAPATSSGLGGVRQAVALHSEQAIVGPAPPTTGHALTAGPTPPGGSAPAALVAAQSPPATSAQRSPMSSGPSSAAGSDSARPATPSAPAADVSREEFQAELDDINTELALMLAEEPSAWNCDELMRRTESLISAAQTSSERAHARLLLNRLTRAAQVKKRYDAVYGLAVTALAPVGSQAGTEAAVQALRGETPLGTTRPTVTPAVVGLANPAASAQQSAEPRVLPGAERTHSPYDATGKLTRVMPGKIGGPRYALLDDHGRIACYVTPAPGVGLQHYVGRRVGIAGTRSALADLNAPHITARHVTPLEGGYRR